MFAFVLNFCLRFVLSFTFVLNRYLGMFVFDREFGIALDTQF